MPASRKRTGVVAAGRTKADVTARRAAGPRADGPDGGRRSAARRKGRESGAPTSKPLSAEGPWNAGRDPERIRWARVMSAQARMAIGYYDREDVKEFLVDAVLEELERN